jgi:CrcB protein
MEPDTTGLVIESGSVEPDVDVHDSRQRHEPPHRPAADPATVSVGGALGPLTRYGLSEAFPHDPGGWSWASRGINVSGCLLVGVLMMHVLASIPGEAQLADSLINEIRTRHRLLRPFLSVGVPSGSPHSPPSRWTCGRWSPINHAGMGLAYLVGTSGGGTGRGNHRLHPHPLSL